MKKGLTLLEFLISVAVLSLIVAVISIGLSKFSKSNELTSSSHNILSLINEARSKSVSSEDALQYGVHFNATSSTLFSGTVFDEMDPDNKEILLPSSVEISDISLNGGGNDIIFKRLTGETDEFGTITLILKYDTSDTKIIDIKESGIAEVN